MAVIPGELLIRDRRTGAVGLDAPDPDRADAAARAVRREAILVDRQSGEPAAVQLVNGLILSAVQKGASDIHIEPYERDVRVRFRIDGQLSTVAPPAPKHRDAIVSRVKIMARLDIAEKRLPQDGRFQVQFSDQGRVRRIDVRVSVLPTMFGEKLVLRLHDPGSLELDLSRLGFDADALEQFERALGRPWGMVLVTGPTGCGKTSTLYASLARLNQPGVNIVTAEDPVEFHLHGVNQVQVREQIGLGFASLLRAFLRQDPNVILVGEIRDADTASIAVRAALTGHLVLSTLHTNDAPSSIHRLVNMGVEPLLAASSINLVCAQRLVRCICEQCRVPHLAPAGSLADADVGESASAPIEVFRGRGCDWCERTGYRGRIGLFEVMDLGDATRALVAANAPAAEVRRQALHDGMVTLRQRGLRKVRDGVTTLEEVLKETM
jgi:type IV pilus assembly protein PilB